MSKKRVLSIGQCGFDQGSLLKAFEPFGVDFISADSANIAIKYLEENNFDLVLVNRVFDQTGESGLDFIKEIAQKNSDTRIMLVSNYEDAQEKAMALGAIKGFGKGDLQSAATHKLLKNTLNGS